MTTINLYILRHGQSKLNESHVLQGQKQFPLGTNGLTEKGIEQAKNAEKIICSLGISKIISSDLERCKETCKIINKKIKASIEFVPELREQSCGDWEGKSSKSLNLENEKLKEVEIVPPNGESLADVEKRVITFLEKYLKNSKDTNILLVTHGAVIQALLGYYLKIDYNYRFRIKPKAGSICHVILKEDRPEVNLGIFSPKL